MDPTSQGASPPRRQERGFCDSASVSRPLPRNSSLGRAATLVRRGAALAVAVALACAPSPASAHRVKHASTGALVRWRAAEITWTLDPSLDRIPGAREAVARGIAAWGGIAGVPRMSIDSDGRARQPALDGKNTVLIGNGRLTSGVDALAVAVVSYDDVTGNILDADIVVAPDAKFLAPTTSHLEEWSGWTTSTPLDKSSGQGGRDQAFDFSGVMAHELGHGLGLGDEPASPTALMYPIARTGPLADIQASSDDASGVRLLYEEPAPGTSGSTQACDAADRGRRPEDATPAVLLMLAAVMASRRRRAHHA